MKPFKTLVFAALLVFSLAFNTFAGEVDVPGAPKPMIFTGEPTITGKPEITDKTNTQETEEAVTSDPSDYLFYEALAALLSVY